jgi:hypothetical protein
MAPEAGLEPATFRLTAGRSTIELLWIPARAAIYELPSPSSNGFYRSCIRPARLGPERAGFGPGAPHLPRSYEAEVGAPFVAEQRFEAVGVDVLRL